MIILATILSSLAFLMSILLLVRLKQISLIMFAKLFAGVFSPYWAIIGATGAIIGWAYHAPWAVLTGTISAGMMTWYVWQCVRDHKGFVKAFGAGWFDQIPPQQAKRMLKRRWSGYLKMEASPEPSLEKDIPFWTIPGTDQQLLCDIWSPADGDVSGMAIIYLHGSGWGAGDKDFLTRPFFNHLVSQGHTVMDVAYRLIPEADIYEMVGDVKRAIAWMKANASHYSVNPEKIILSGSSAGCHLALLAGYTPEHPDLTPEDLKSTDLSVCGVISYYGPTDLITKYNQWMNMRRPDDFRFAGRLDMLLGGSPQEVPDAYQLATPANHVTSGSPPTLLFQGSRDILVPVEATRALYTKLVEENVPAVCVVFPWTEHMFDLILPYISPPAQSALYDTDRFLALLLTKDKKSQGDEQ